MKTAPTVIERFADNGEHSHWELINTDTGEVLWNGEWPTEGTNLYSQGQIEDVRDTAYNEGLENVMPLDMRKLPPPFLIHKDKEKRHRKLNIIKVGWFDKDGRPEGWGFDGQSHPDSVGVKFNPETFKPIHFGGYTIEELRYISSPTPLDKEGYGKEEKFKHTIYSFRLPFSDGSFTFYELQDDGNYKNEQGDIQSLDFFLQKDKEEIGFTDGICHCKTIVGIDRNGCCRTCGGEIVK